MKNPSIDRSIEQREEKKKERELSLLEWDLAEVRLMLFLSFLVDFRWVFDKTRWWVGVGLAE